MKKQAESNVMKGKSYGTVLKAAKEDGGHKAVTKVANAPEVVPAGNPKSVTIKCVLNGYKVCWVKPGEWQDQEAVAKDLPEAMEIAKTYLEAADDEA